MIDITLKLKPLLKYPGGKSDELPYIMKFIPDNINNYIEPFVGGGAVYFYLNNSYNFINDKSEELMLLYNYIKSNNRTFYSELDNIINNWNKLSELSNDERITELFVQYRLGRNINMAKQLSEIIKIDNIPMFNLHSDINFEKFLMRCLSAKFEILRKNEILKKETLRAETLKENLEAGIKAAYYTYLRDVYNNPKEYNNLSRPRKVAIYLFIREYCFSSMFRFNNAGGFNVPYGGVSYNKKSLENKKKYYKSLAVRKLLNNTELYQMDFYEFVKTININEDDFMFLDPPYDTVFSEYDKNAFDQNDQIRLANYLIYECPCKFMLIIKKTDNIDRLYQNSGLNIVEMNKNYFVSFKNRNKKSVKHLIITNY